MSHLQIDLQVSIWIWSRYVTHKCLEQLQLKYATQPYSSIHVFLHGVLLLELNAVRTSVWIFDGFEIVNTHSEAAQHRVPQIFQLCCKR